MIQISSKGLSGIDDTIIKQLRNEFLVKRCIVLPCLIAADLLEKALRSIEAAAFYENQHLTNENKVFATDLSIDGANMALHQISFLLNNKELFKLIEAVTGCTIIRGFSGRIYRNMPNTIHSLHWHDDRTDETRLIALSMNLSAEKFENGKFQIRKKGTKEILREVSCGNLGDTHIFDVSANLEHRVTATTGAHPRTAAAGWFTSVPAENYLFTNLKNGSIKHQHQAE